MIVIKIYDSFFGLISLTAITISWYKLGVPAMAKVYRNKKLLFNDIKTIKKKIKEVQVFFL
jgi:hypothetical protein